MFFSSLIQELSHAWKILNCFAALHLKNVNSQSGLIGQKKKTEPKNFNKMRQRKQEFMFQMVHTCIYCLIYITSHGVRVFKST